MTISGDEETRWERVVSPLMPPGSADDTYECVRTSNICINCIDVTRIPEFRRYRYTEIFYTFIPNTRNITKLSVYVMYIRGVQINFVGEMFEVRHAKIPGRPESKITWCK